jgi:hypothetical protein
MPCELPEIRTLNPDEENRSEESLPAAVPEQSGNPLSKPDQQKNSFHAPLFTAVR